MRKGHSITVLVPAAVFAGVFAVAIPSIRAAGQSGGASTTALGDRIV
jgi:hypothetical protein